MPDDNTILDNMDVEEIEQEEKIEELHPRLKALENVSNRRKQELIENGVDIEIEEVEKIEDEKEKEVEEEKLDSSKENIPTTYKIKIDGIEEEKTIDELIRGYQKEAAGSKKLREAAELKKILESKEEDLNKREKEFLNKLELDSNKEEKEEDDNKSILDINPAEIARMLREGEEEEAANAIQKLIESVNKKEAKGKSTKDIQNLVDAAIQTERKRQEEEEKKRAKEAEILALQSEMESAENAFKETFKDALEKSEYFFDLAIVQDKKLENDPEWKDRSLKDRYEEAGNRAKKILNLDVKDLRVDKKEKKKKIINLPSSSAREATKQEEDKASASDIIAEIKKARGQK